MTSFKLIGTAVVLSAFLALPASACGPVSEPGAAAASNPKFSIYADNCGLSASSYPMAAQPFNSYAMAERRSTKPSRAHRAPIRH